MAPMYPNLNSCRKPSGLPLYANDLDCCPPRQDEPPKKFEFPKDLEMRTRLAAHKVDSHYVEKYGQAIKLMKELPDDDPRNFMQQANVHCAYCDGAYYMGDTDKPFKVHAGWFFLPWHRWFLYFYERILAKLLEDDTFALPFWNWDLEDGMTIPPMYVDPMSPLYDEKRNPEHANGGFVDLSFISKSNVSSASLSKAELVDKNYKIMYTQVVSQTSTRAFHGQEIRADSQICGCGAGSLERDTHNIVHDWTGSVPTSENDCACPSKTCKGEDMGIFYSAARDPIFFAHHANVDRLWTIWKTLPGARKDYNDPDLLDTKFYFYDENKVLVEVRAGDAFDPEKLRYKYEDSPTPWSEKRPVEKPTPISQQRSSAPKKAASSRLLLSSPPTIDAVETLDLTNPKFKKPVKLNVPRDLPSSRASELLVIEGIRAQRNIAVKFDVFVQLDDYLVAMDYVDMVPPEYVGTFVELRRGTIDDMESGCGQSSMRVEISEVLKDLNVGEEKKDIMVTLIPKVNLERPIQISAVRMEYE